MGSSIARRTPSMVMVLPPFQIFYINFFIKPALFPFGQPGVYPYIPLPPQTNTDEKNNIFSLYRLHHPLAIQAGDMHVLGRPDRVPTAGADILPAAGFLGEREGRMLIAGNEDIRQAGFQDEVQ